MIKKYYYTIFGFQVESELELPELLPGDGSPDVVISLGTTPKKLSNSVVKNFRFESTPNDFLLKVDATANYLVSNGKKITVEILEQKNTEKVRLFLLKSVFGVLCYQRGLFPFHGSAVSLSGKAVLFLSHLSHGVSTLAALCCNNNNGYQLLSDNLTMLSFQKEVMVEPSFPRIELWKNTLSFLGEDVTKLQRVRTGLDKFSKKYSQEFSSKPLPVKRIYVLSPDRSEEIDTSEITGKEAMQAILSCAYHPDFLSCPQQRQEQFKQCVDLVEKTAIIQLSLPDSLEGIREIPFHIKNNIRT